MNSDLSLIVNSDSIIAHDNLTSYEFDLEDELNVSAGVTLLTQILAILGICISTIGIIGNLFSIIVLTRKSMKRLSTYSYLLGLSICDEISLIFTIIILLQYTLPKTKLFQTLNINHQKILIFIYPIVASTQALSVWITMVFTIDRYLYVCHPYYGRLFCTRKRASIVLCCLYALASIYSIPQIFERTYVTHDVLGKIHLFQTLTDLGKNRYFIYVYHLFIYCIFVVFIPFTTIVVLNGFLVYDIIKSNRRHRDLNLNYRHSISNVNPVRANSASNVFSMFRKKNSENHSETSAAYIEPCLPNATQHKFSYEKYFTLRNDVTIMLIGLIVVFLICQSPSVVLRIITFKNLSIYFQPIYYSSLDVSNFLIVTNSTLNCILYVMLGKKFRKEFLATFFASKCCADPTKEFQSATNRPDISKKAPEINNTTQS